MPAQPGERHALAKLTDEKVARMRESYSTGGVSMMELGNEFDVCPSTVRSVLAGRTWKHVPPVSTKPCGGCHGTGRVPV